MNMKDKKINYDEGYFTDRIIEKKHYVMVMDWILDLFPKKVYDIGCGRGPYVHAFNYYGIDCKGYDISEKAIKNPVGLAKGKISNVHDDKNKYDLVTCIDVLEHIPRNEEKEFIEKICKSCSKYILLSICDITLKNVYKDETHCNLRTKKYWIKQFVDSGFEELKVSTDWKFNNQMYLFKKKEVIKNGRRKRKSKK